MYLKESQLPNLITTLDETISDKQANELLWKVIYYDNFDDRFAGFVPNIYGNTIFIKKDGEYKNKSKRPLLPFYYDDNYFYCWSLQGADDEKLIFSEKIDINNPIFKKLYFLESLRNINSLPNKDSFVHLDKIIKIDKKFLYDAINRNHFVFKNTNYIDLDVRTKLLTKALIVWEEMKNVLEINTLILFRKKYDSKTKRFVYVDNLFYDVDDLQTNSKGQKYLNIAIVEYVGKEKYEIKLKDFSFNKNWLDVQNYQKRNFNKTLSKTNKMSDLIDNILFNTVTKRIEKIDNNKKTEWFDNLDSTELKEKQKILKIKNTFKREKIKNKFDKTLGINKIGEKNINNLKDFYIEHIQESYKKETRQKEMFKKEFEKER